jgi:hypothetical protein
VNGLRSKLPPLAGDPKHEAPVESERRSAREPPTRRSSPPEPVVNSVLFGIAAVTSLPDFPTLPGAVGRATLGVVPSVGIEVDSFFPMAGRELVSSEMTATVRTTWIRLGPRFGGEVGDFHLSGAALAGPAVTWATAVAAQPRVGGADVTTGAILSLAALVEYPHKGPVFASGSASVSALVPGVRVSLGESAPAPRGSWPLEVSIGFGARWGDR